jgi:hypothetical protein
MPQMWVAQDELVQVEDGSDTVDGTANAITDFFTVPGNAAMIRFKCETGGPIRINSFEAPTAGGTEGSTEILVGDHWEVWGSEDIANHQMIVATGGSNSFVTAQVFRYRT